MALKAESPLVDYIEVSSSVLRFKEKEETAADPPLPNRTLVKRDGSPTDVASRGAPPLARVGPEEPGGSWRQEYLIAERSGCGQPVCMVCGGLLSASGPAAARKHIQRHHAHSLGFSPEEKRNILEAWGEGAVLPATEPPPRPAGSPRESKRPAEIEVLLDSEEQPASRKRGQPKARCEVARLDPERRSQSQQRRNGAGNAKDGRSNQPIQAAGKEWLSECGVPGSAPAEIRIFTDGTFPAGFALKLYCRAQPEPAQDTEAKPNTRQRTVDRKCSVSLLRLHPPDAPRHPAPCPLGRPAGTRTTDCDSRPGQQGAAAGQQEAALLATTGFNPAWRARFLMDFDATAGRLVCMVCEYPLRRSCLASIKRHILQCHAETLHLPREVRRTIREVWESRGQPPAQAPRK